MIKRIVGTVFAVGIFVLGYSTLSQASSVKVTEGRSALFNNGSPTVPGILTANTAFASAVQSDATDSEARFFTAVTRVLASALTKSPTNSGLTTIRDLLESFGITRNNNDYLDIDSPYDAPLEVDDKYYPPTTIPSASKVTDYLAGPLVTMLNASIADLDVIIKSTSSFTLTLTATETGNLPVEIDLGDVLTLKALLCTIKAQAMIFHAWDMDNADLRQIFILGNAGVFQLQRDLLDKYTKLMKLKTTSSTTMTAAKTALLLAIDTSQLAYDSISNEVDAQTDDLFTFADQQEMDAAKDALITLNEVKNSIVGNRPALVGNGAIDDVDAKFDFSVLFGKSGQAPIDIRSHLPKFTADGEFATAPIDPTIGGLWPNMTQDEWPSLTTEIPVKTITIDGSASDWNGIPNLGEGWPWSYNNSTPPATIDIQTLSIARDAKYLYWMIKTASPPPGKDINVGIGFYNEDSSGNSNVYAEIELDESGNMSYLLYTYDLNWNMDELPTSNSDIRIGNVIEGRILLSQLPGFTKLILGAEIWQSLGMDADSWNSDTFLLLPTTTVSGTIQYNPKVTGINVGKTFITAYSGPIPQISTLLGSAVISDVGAYSIPGLPIGSTIYLFAYGDTDNNGIMNSGDYSGTATVKPLTSTDIKNLGITRISPSETELSATIHPGWNLLSSPIGFNVPATLMPAKASITSAWKWHGSKWEVYITTDGDGGKTYAASKGFGFLEEITPGEGFWLNSPSKVPFNMPLLGVPDIGPLALANGWNLVGLKGEYPTYVSTISAENSGIVSIWKWDNGKWSVALPGEETPGGYAASKGFSHLSTINPGEGIWINK